MSGKVGIVSGGGSGHLPVFTGYVGKGLLDACAIGDVFSSPAVDQMAEAIRAANGGVGVLRLYGNYGGDNMNFDMAGEMVEMEDIRTTTVRVADDVASAPPAERSKRRGVAGLVYAYKIAGAKADQRATLDEVTATPRRPWTPAARLASPSHPAPSRRGAPDIRNQRERRWKSAWEFTASRACAEALCAPRTPSRRRCFLSSC